MFRTHAKKVIQTLTQLFQTLTQLFPSVFQSLLNTPGAPRGRGWFLSNPGVTGTHRVCCRARAVRTGPGSVKDENGPARH